MANVIRDNNRVPGLLASSSVVSTTSLALTATPISGVNPLNVAIMDSTGAQISTFGGNGAIADGVSSSILATVADLTNSNPLAVEVVDATGTQITSFGASTADGSTFTQNTSTGGISMGVYQSSPDTITTGKSAAIGIDVNRNTRVVGSVASAATDSGNPVKIGGVYNSSPITYTNGQRADRQVDVNGNEHVNLNTLIAGENQTTNRLNVEPIYSFLNITTNTTTTVKPGAGTFAGFTVNNNGFTTAGTITIYDNTAGSGTKIGTWTIPVEPPGSTVLGTSFVPPQLGMNASFTTGLTFVTATTAPAADITVLYR